jgi:hypothetical protein
LIISFVEIIRFSEFGGFYEEFIKNSAEFREITKKLIRNLEGFHVEFLYPYFF